MVERDHDGGYSGADIRQYATGSPASMPDEDRIARIIEQAAERGAQRALHAVGLDDEDAVRDIRDARDLAKMMREIKGQVLRTVTTSVTVGIIALLAAAIAIKAKIGLE